MKKKLLIVIFSLLNLFCFAQDGEWISYSDGIHSDFVNYSPSVSNYDIAILFTPDDIQEKGFTEISAIRAFIPDSPPSASAVFKIWQGADGLEEKVSLSFIPEPSGTWTEVKLDVPFIVDAGQDLWVGIRYQAINPYHPLASSDASLDYPGKGNLMRPIQEGIPGEWTTNLYPGDWNIQIAVNMPLNYKVMFTNIKTLDSSGDEVSDAVISLGYQTNKPGDYEFDVLPGTYKYIISKHGYTSITGMIEVIDRDIEVDMSDKLLKPGINTFHEIKFDVQDSNGNIVEDAVVTFNKYEWGPGIYVANNVKPGVYDYTISKFGYVPVEGSVIVVGDETVPVRMTILPKHKVTFMVQAFSEGKIAPYQNAIVSLDTIINQMGNYEFNNIPAGIYNYIVKAEGFTTKTGQIEVSDKDETKGEMIMTGETPTFSIELRVKNENDLYPEDLSVITIGDSILEKGNYRLDGLQPGIYDYKIECEGYITKTGKIVLTEDVFTDITLIKLPSYLVLFSISDEQGKPIEDAAITFDNEVLPAGNYLIESLCGTYTYEISKDGYETKEGEVEIVDRDKIVTVTLNDSGSGLNEELFSGIFPYPNPLKDYLYLNDPLQIIRTLTINSSDGRIVVNTELNGKKNISIGMLEKGIYFITLQDEEGNKKKYKMIKK